MKLQQAVVLITGASRGLGRALVEASAAAGARRVYATARNPAQLADLARRDPARIVPLALDVTDARSIAAAAAAARDVTVLVNNAGVLGSHGVLTTELDALRADFETNVVGLLAVTRALLPALERAAGAGGAAIVNVASIGSLASVPVYGGYVATKAAALSITQSLRAELAGRGIRVHAALPGMIDTDMVRAATLPKTSPEAVARELLAGLEADAEDIYPDGMARDLHAMWRRDPKELERTLGAALG